MLTGPMIEQMVREGKIEIDPFDPSRINPNSYDLTLGEDIVLLLPIQTPVSVINFFDEDNETCETPVSKIARKKIKIHDSGFQVLPGYCVLATTVERTYSPYHIPQITGKSSLARNFVCVHQTAGFGDTNFNGQWTLEITAGLPFTLYPGMKIAQIYFSTPEGPILPYNGRYQDQSGPTEARPEKK